MRNIVLLLFCSVLLLSCSTDDKSETPILNLVGIFVNDDKTNYARYLDDLPSLSVGDEVDISFYLNGNGNYLRTFVLKNENPTINTSLFFYVDDVSDELTEINNGLLAFKDIEETNVAVKAKVVSFSEEDACLSFFLSSKAIDCEGATFKLNLTLKKEEEQL